jgi:hypothetical protein
LKGGPNNRGKAAGGAYSRTYWDAKGGTHLGSVDVSGTYSLKRGKG